MVAPGLGRYSDPVVEKGQLTSREINRPVVLIVEDDFLIRMGAVDMVQAAGFDVVEAANADEAILILEDRLDITVVFIDIPMPGSMDGLKLATAIRGRWPPIKIVATSGSVKVSADDRPEGGRFLPKPYCAPPHCLGRRPVLTGSECRRSPEPAFLSRRVLHLAPPKSA